MGTVWRADDLTLGSPVAIKLLDPSYAQDESVRARFYQEARAAAALRSPNVVQILDHGVDGDVPFIAMELLDGEDLAQRLHRSGRLSPAETVRIFADVARAVRKAHEAGIVHRDLKPDNIFIVRDDDHEIAKVLDFGVAKSAHASGAQGMGTQAGALIGTLPYMSPEQARGASVDHRADLWALGAIAFECMCGRLPFTADAPGELVLQICSLQLPVPSRIAPVPPAFDDWFTLACNRDPNERFSSAKAMTEALRTALLGQGDADPSARASMPAASVPLVAAPLSDPRPVQAAVPRPPTINGGSTIDSALPVRRSSSMAGVALSLVALLIAAGLFVRWLVLRDGADGSGAPVAAASPAALDPAPPPSSKPSAAEVALSPGAAPSSGASPEGPPTSSHAGSSPALSAQGSGSRAVPVASAPAGTPGSKPSAKPSEAAPSAPAPKPALPGAPTATATSTATNRLGF